MDKLFTDLRKAQELTLRVYNGKMIEEDKEKNIMGDEKAITALCSKVFGDGSESPDPSLLHQFNNIVVRTADIVAQPDLELMIKYFANYQTVPADTQVIQYDKPHPVGLRFKWSAIGTDVTYKKVEGGEIDTLVLSQIQAGITYNTLTKESRAVEMFRALVAQVAQAKVTLVYETLMNLVQEAVVANTGIIPSSQICDKSGATSADFDKVANIIARRTGTRPIFLADIALIQYFVNKLPANVITALPESMKSDFYNNDVTNLRTADAVKMVNEFTTFKGTETQFPVNRGFIFGGSGYSKKPFEVALAGGLVQKTEDDFIHGKVNMIIRQTIGIDLLAGEAIGYIEEDSVVNPW